MGCSPAADIEPVCNLLIRLTRSQERQDLLLAPGEMTCYPRHGPAGDAPGSEEGGRSVGLGGGPDSLKKRKRVSRFGDRQLGLTLGKGKCKLEPRLRCFEGQLELIKKCKRLLEITDCKVQVLFRRSNATLSQGSMRRHDAGAFDSDDFLELVCCQASTFSIALSKTGFDQKT